MSKLIRVPWPTPESMSDINMVSWQEVWGSPEAREIAESCVNRILWKFEGIVFGRDSSCSIVGLAQKKEEEVLVEDRRLANWKRWIEIREKESEKLRKKLYRRRNDLLLNVDPNAYRTAVKQKEIIDKSADAFGALNFHKIPEKSRQELILTLPRSQRVTPVEIVYTQTPDLILREQKIMKSNAQLKVGEEFTRHVPSMTHLALRGNADGDGCHENPREIESIQLSQKKFIKVPERRQVLIVGGVEVDKIFPNVNVLIDLVFEGFEQMRQTKTLRLENRGEIAINLTFKKAKVDADDVIGRSPQCFFFSKHTFRTVPDDDIEIPFHFYPTRAGAFSETWTIVCDPEFSQECEIQVCLFGHCKERINEEDALAMIEEEITRKSAQLDIERVIKSMLQLTSAEKPHERRKPFTDPIELKFAQMNPKLHYHEEHVEALSRIYDEMNVDGTEWNCGVDELYKMILEVSDIEKQKKLYHDFMEQFNQLKNLREELKTDDDEKSAKLSMIKNVFGKFLEQFDDDICNESKKGDCGNLIKKKLCESIDKMIHIVES